MLSEKKELGLELSRTFLYRIFYGDHLALCIGSYTIAPWMSKLGIDFASAVQTVQEVHG